jgi:flagellar hook-associated protein 1 FlgK
VPADVIPDPNTVPPTSVSYVDFSRNMKVNQDIENDITLLRTGTVTQDVTPPTGDNALIRRIVEFAFGDVHYEEAVGTVDLNVAAPAADLQEWLGITSVNNVILGGDFSSFPEIDDGIPGNNDFIEQFQDFFLDFPDNDAFEIRFDDPRTGLGAFDINVDLSHASENFPIDGITINNALDQILAETNFQIANTPGFPPEYAAVATTNNYGQLVIQTTANVELNGAFTVLPIDGPAAPHAGDSDRMSPDALASLGLSPATFTTEDPNFTVQIGNNDPVTITIEPGDTTADLIAKLEYDPVTGQGVPGLFVDFDAINGTISLRPGIDDNNWAPLDTEPVYGGDIKITGGPFSADPATAGNPTIAGASQPLSIVAAIFGNFTDDGLTVTENSVTSSVGYSLQESIPVAPLTATFTNIRNDFLGPNAAVQTGIFSANNILDFAQKIVDETSQDYIQAESALENEDTLRGILQRQFSDESGVNIDEEMSNLIVVQTAYAAAARVITSADEMFQELINSIRR